MAKVQNSMEVINRPGGELENAEFGKNEMQVLFQAGVIPDKTPIAQVKLFARVCAEKRLSPFSKQLYLTCYNTKEGPKYSIITGIDGYRSLASRTGLYAGCEAPQFNATKKDWFTMAEMIEGGKKQPISCRFTIYKIVAGQRVPFVGEVLFDEYCSRNSQGNPIQKWATMPFNMLSKCAEAKAYKKAFPDELSGLSIPEEQAAWEDTNTGMVTEPIAETKEERAELLEQIEATLQGLDLAGLKAFYNDNPILVQDPDVLQLLTNRKNELKNG